MTTRADAADLLEQAKAFDEAADALSPKVNDAGTPLEDRKKLFQQSLSLRSEAFKLRTQAAENTTKELSVEVAALKAEIERAKKVLGSIAKVKAVIDVGTSLTKLAAAIATGQPAGIASALSALKTDVDRVQHG